MVSFTKVSPTRFQSRLQFCPTFYPCNCSQSYDFLIAQMGPSPPHGVLYGGFAYAAWPCNSNNFGNIANLKSADHSVRVPLNSADHIIFEILIFYILAIYH